MNDRQYIHESKLPVVVRVGKAGFFLSLLGLSVGGAVVRVLNAFMPGLKGNGIPAWAWPVLIAIWTPGLVGFVLSFYSIARYPYLNMATGGGPNIAVTSRWIWVPLGLLLYLLAPLFALAALGNMEEPALAACMVLLAVELAFVGFLLTAYRKDQHLTIATFLELTFGIGIVMFPIYIPTLIVGTIRCRRFLKTLPGTSGKGDTSAK